MKTEEASAALLKETVDTKQLWKQVVGGGGEGEGDVGSDGERALSLFKTNWQ